MKSNKLVSLGLLCLAFMSFQCDKPGDNNPSEPIKNVHSDVQFYMTSADEKSLLQKQNYTLNFSEISNNYPTINVDTTQTFQTIDGFGYTLTGGSAIVLNKMDQNSRTQLLRQLFSSDSNSIRISYLRVSIGASDLDPAPFSYNDLPEGQQDLTLSKFSLDPDRSNLIPILKEILQINPNIKIMGSPWSPPTWMKSNNKTIGGTLLPEYYDVYAQYFVKYIQGMAAEGITIDAITVQNEPLHPGNNPSLLMEAPQQLTFVKNHLGPAFKNAAIKTKIVIYDHNCDKPEYPISILNDADAAQYIDGSAFHLYGGNISSLSQVYQAHPTKNLYFTEQWVGKNEGFSGPFMWHMENVIIGSMRHHSKIALEWNLANDANFGPHTDGGCSECKGALTITGNQVTYNPAYYIIGQVSKWVPAGSVRIQSDVAAGLPNVAFLRPDGKKVLVIANTNDNNLTFNLGYKGKKVPILLKGKSAGTLIW